MRLDASASLLRLSYRGYKAGSTSAVTLSNDFTHRRHASFDALESGESSRGTETIQQPMGPLGSLFERTNLHSNLTDMSIINRQPDLAALDQLNPGGRTGGKDARVHLDIWKKTLRRVMHSFNFHQLEKLCREADVPRSILSKYKVKSMQKANKEVRAKALLLHRFRMSDPALRAQEQALQKAKATTIQTLEVPISQIALLLLALSGQAELQRLLQAQRIRLLPIKVEKDESLLLILQGSKQGTGNVQAWLSSFFDRIQSITRPLSSFSISDSIFPPDDHRLRLISQISQTIVSLDKSARDVTIHSVDEAALATAETMLSQYLHDAQLMQKRQYHSYASPSNRTSSEGEVWTEERASFAFVPHVGPSPLPWQSDPGTNASLFRIASQNSNTPGENVFTEAKQDKQRKALLQKVFANETSTEGDIFTSLRHIVGDNRTNFGTWAYTADFGHLLFNNHHRTTSSRVLNLVYPPLGGSWQLNTGLQWLQEIAKDGNSPSNAPSFCLDIPPLAFSLDAGFITPAPYAPSTRSSTSSEDDEVHRSNEKWSEELLRMGFPLGLGRSKNELTNVVNLSAPGFTESIVITYAGKDSDLVFRVRAGDAIGNVSPHTTFLDGEISRRAVADVLVPEASVDLRLSAINSDAVAKENLYTDEQLRRYFEGSADLAAEEKEEVVALEEEEGPEVSLSGPSGAEEKAEVENEHQSGPLPRRVIVKGQEFIFVSAKKTDRWEWPIETEPAKQYNGKMILERAASDQKGDYISSFRVHFGEKGVAESILPQEAKRADEVHQETDSMEESVMPSLSSADTTDENGKEETSRIIETENGAMMPLSTIPQWNSLRTYVDVFFARGYRSIRGR